MFSLYDSSTLFITSTENLSSWKVFVNEEIRNQYNRELFHATVYMAVIFCLGFITCFFYVVPTEQDGRIYFAIPISAMYFPNYINFFFVWCCRAAFIPAAYLSIVQPTLRIMYCWIHVRFHLLRCLFLLENLNTFCNSQDEVGKRMKCCLRYHGQICRQDFWTCGDKCVKFVLQNFARHFTWYSSLCFAVSGDWHAFDRKCRGLLVLGGY